MRNEDAAMGVLVREYAANERTLAALLTELDATGKGLRLLGGALVDRPGRIELTSQEFRFEAQGQRWAVPDTVLRADVLREHLAELAVAFEEKRRMEDRLRQANMENLIKEGKNP